MTRSLVRRIPYIYEINGVVEGTATYLPGLHERFIRGRGHHTSSASNCYSTWFRHFLTARDHGVDVGRGVVIEVGPGASLGTGLMALLTGARHYCSLERIRPLGLEPNLRVLDELVNLLRRRAPIPHTGECADIKPALASYRFPQSTLDDARLEDCLREERLEAIRCALKEPGRSFDGIQIQCLVPWDSMSVDPRLAADFVFSSAVMEHVDDVESTYEALRRWMSPKAIMSHQIDFKSHGTAYKWNGHWAYSDWLWRRIRGRRPYLINREPAETHLRMMRNAGFTVVSELRVRNHAGLARENLAPRFKGISDLDLTTSGIHVLARSSCW